MKTINRRGHRINSAEGRTPHEPSSVICMQLAARITYSDGSLYDSDSLCFTVATSSELVATREGGRESLACVVPQNAAFGVLPRALWPLSLLALACAGP